MEIKIKLNEKQVAQYHAFVKEQEEKAIEIQKAKILPSDAFYSTFVESWDMGYPYYGAIGGAYEFRICPTSLGEAIYIKNTYTGEELNLTDYSNW